ncbi:MAG TPA: hypothetical protein VGM84_06810 [Steroidobacteraceae bacterium]|jgi:hypothetical protein
MSETYAFLAMFAIQIVTGSVLCPALFIRRIRADAASFPDERFAELFPGVDKNISTERFVTRFRVQNTGLAVLGLLLLGYLFIDMRSPDRNAGQMPVVLVSVYLVAQLIPLFLIGRNGARYNRMLKSSLADGKRKAVLQRRGLFDFVSPFTVSLAALSYFLLFALVIYIRQHPFPGYGGFTNVGIITLLYAVSAFVVYGQIYGGKKGNPLATHADRLHAIGAVVKTLVYTCIGGSLFVSLDLMLGLLRLGKWGPFAVDAFIVVSAIVSYPSILPRRRPKGDGLGSGGPLPPPGTRDLPA